MRETVAGSGRHLPHKVVLEPYWEAGVARIASMTPEEHRREWLCRNHRLERRKNLERSEAYQSSLQKRRERYASRELKRPEMSEESRARQRAGAASGRQRLHDPE